MTLPISVAVFWFETESLLHLNVAAAILNDSVPYLYFGNKAEALFYP
jgi:hypothetical protein